MTPTIPFVQFIKESPIFLTHMEKFDNCTAFTNDELAELAYSVTPFIDLGNDDTKLPIEAKRMFVGDHLYEDDMLKTYREYCVKNGYETWEENGKDFFNTYFENDVYGAVEAVCRGDYRTSDDLVRFDGYANLESADTSAVYDEAMGEDSFITYAFDNSPDSDLQDISEAEIDILELAQWLICMGYQKPEKED